MTIPVCLRATALLCGLACLTVPVPALAGTVEVRFIEPQRFADIGRGTIEQERNLEILEHHFKKFGAKLPDNQQLKIDVLDVDLAGEVWPTRRFDDVRILRGSADWPRMTLRWSLVVDGATIRSGEDRLADMAYLMYSARLPDSRALSYDLRMVNAWFAKNVARELPQ